MKLPKKVKRVGGKLSAARNGIAICDCCGLHVAIPHPMVEDVCKCEWNRVLQELAKLNDEKALAKIRVDAANESAQESWEQVRIYEDLQREFVEFLQTSIQQAQETRHMPDIHQEIFEAYCEIVINAHKKRH